MVNEAGTPHLYQTRTHDRMIAAYGGRHGRGGGIQWPRGIGGERCGIGVGVVRMSGIDAWQDMVVTTYSISQQQAVKHCRLAFRVLL